MTYQTKRRAYFASSIVFRLCLAAVIIYILASLLFYFIGKQQFERFEDKILSNPLVYAIPVLMILGLAGTYIFREREDDVYEEADFYPEKSSGRLSPLLPTVLGVCLVALAVYLIGFKKPANENYLSANSGPRAAMLARTKEATELTNKKSVGIKKVEPVNNKVVGSTNTVPMPTVNNNPAPNNVNSVPAKTAAVAKVEEPKIKSKTDSVILPPTQDGSDEGVPSPSFAKRNKKYTNVEVKYRIVSKAYLYNAPTASARRNAFIKSNSYTTLLPKAEKGNFIYVVYTNDKGETTMGWLNKKELKPVNEIVYNSGKS